MHPSRIYMVSNLTFKYLIHFEFFLHVCVWCEIEVLFHSFPCGYPVLLAPFIEETFLHCVFFAAQKISWPQIHESILGLYILFPVGIPVFILASLFSGEWAKSILSLKDLSNFFPVYWNVNEERKNSKFCVILQHWASIWGHQLYKKFAVVQLGLHVKMPKKSIINGSLNP